MALKNWKKLDDKEFDVWENEKTSPHGFIKIWKPYLDEHKHNVVITNGRSVVSRHPFKKYSPAFKFAKKYMKTH